MLPILNCGVGLVLDDNGQSIEAARISLGPVAPVPFRARQTEAFLNGKSADANTFVQAAEVAAEEAKPRTSLLRASKEYRMRVLQVLIRQGLTRSTDQARARAG